MRSPTVRDAMSSDVVTVPVGTTIGMAVDRVLRAGHTHVVVVDDVGALLDIVSAHLLATAMLTRLVERDQALAGVLAAPASVPPEAGLADAAELMLERAVDAVGVVEAPDRLVGILTWADIGRTAVGAVTFDPAASRAGRGPSGEEGAHP